ncbi:N-acetylmuramic acid 6-phosphate etherase [Rubrivirga sp. SAORIC476]|mgnify:FL=1|uniref:N-acetylmuramic acid 6-phosphate etherase n=1 Tax=Rubrivirga sp. SAORIC476 TaxID=1961794 RepID=UPI000BA90B95|nr:N-acetylmuramic acid 6-phosphate etherase [Rubrivirga sp. SAORIC476]MBC12948.1 N-acetylmuramic acid 6-phosphate etherase [Rhodothermaceae bacterium]PAP81550.1 N-acetylmuramic acid 6-phosphate etherase [Rubrivirga sp. SAORIC476]
MPDRPALFDELQTLTTETRNPRTLTIDTAPLPEVVQMLHEEDQRAVDAVTPELPYVVQAVEIIEHAFRNGGRLFYAGAGTSGRLGVLDAAECPPTFGTPPEQVQGLIAGGQAAMFVAQEGAEDHESNGAEDIDAAGVTERDVVCGIAASRRTPYVVGAVARARELGAKTLFVTCNPRSRFDLDVDVAICADVGPEPIMGSTRMKSGTATKLILNMLSTATMVRLGKVYENMMVDLQMTNLKLVERSKKIVMTATGVDYDTAAEVLDAADGHVKTALVMVLADVDAEAARARIEEADGFVRHAIAGTRPGAASG